MESSEGPVMTVDDLAAYLRIPRSSAYKLAQRGKVPCQKVGRHWRFSRAAIDRWLEGQSGSREGREGARGD
jgi:excisionase family DNA binding protein